MWRIECGDKGWFREESKLSLEDKGVHTAEAAGCAATTATRLDHK